MDNWDAMIGVARYPSYKARIVKFSIQYNWKWNQRAFFNLTDKFGVAWSGGYDMLDDHALYGYRPMGVNS